VSTVSTVPRAARIDRTTLVRRGLTAAGLALLAVALVRVVAVSLAPDLAALPPLGWGPLVASTLIAAAGATLVYALLSDRPTATRDFLAVAATVLVVSFVPVVTVAPTVPGMSTAGLVALGAAHVAVAVGIVGPLVGRRPA
jgi:hypothetical protein